MPRYCLTVCLLCLSACATGGVDVWGGTSKTVSVQDYRFKIIHTDTRAEAYRIGVVLRSDATQIFAAARQAMEQASGCEVILPSVTGDVALVEADLSC